jgi:heme/copper-type cytochrome/quinol oxidase subunit 2
MLSLFRRRARPAPGGETLLLTILQFIGSAIVGVFYVTILVAFATRKKAGASPDKHEEKAPQTS